MRRSLSALLALAAVTILAAWMARPRPAAEPHGEWVKFTNAAGDSIPAYIAWPERSDRAPTVLVIHQIFGLTEWETTVVNKLAAQGYVAIAPDLLASKYGKSPASPDSARKLFAGLTTERVMGDLDATAAFVDTLPGAARGQMASIGFCWGGQQSFAYATHNPEAQGRRRLLRPGPRFRGDGTHPGADPGRLRRE